MFVAWPGLLILELKSLMWGEVYIETFTGLLKIKNSISTHLQNSYRSIILKHNHIKAVFLFRQFSHCSRFHESGVIWFLLQIRRLLIQLYEDLAIHGVIMYSE